MEKTPNKMTGGTVGAMAQQIGAIDQTTGMPVNQMQQSPINPMALGGFDPQSLTGVPQPAQSFNNIMSQNK